MNIKNRGKALHRATLSERIRPNGEAAPWIIDEIKTMEKELREAKIDVDRLNEMLRRTGYGQGQIDTYVAQCEEIEKLKQENEYLYLGWCRESEKRMKEWSNEGEKLTELHKVIHELRRSIDSHKDKIASLEAVCEYWKSKYEIYVEDATGNDEIS